ncbi:hypothetical protein C8R47DRAFT_1069243 [Mycena vitilis]|nr:hypothetical protein C8R47DRAFT_1069243 [Mycena vitilis]
MASHSPGMPPLEKAWTPRLPPLQDDRAVFENAPFKEIIGYYYLQAKRQTRTGSSSDGSALFALLSTQLDTPEWTEFASDWLSYTLGGEIVEQMAEDALKRGWILILDVFFLRFMHAGRPSGDELAEQLLLAAQNQHFKSYRRPPADFCWLDDLEPYSELSSSEDSDCDMDTGEDLESDAESEYEDESYKFIIVEDDEEDDPMGDDDPIVEDDPMDDDNPVYESMFDDDFIPDYSQSRDPPVKRAAPKKSKKSRLLEEPLEHMPFRWVRRLKIFFFPDANIKSQRSAKDVVHDFCQMRDLPKRDYNNGGFQSALKESGLVDTLEEICELGNLLETSHSDVERSFRFHHWKDSYGEILCKWTKEKIMPEDYEHLRDKPDPQYKFNPQDVEDLFMFISDHRRMQPWIYDPLAAFFLISLDCFTFYSEYWLVPCLKKLSYPRIAGWNPKIVYDRIMQHPLLMNASDPTSVAFLEALADQKLATVVHETWWHRDFLNTAKNEIYGNPGPSPDSPHSTTSTTTPATSSAASGSTLRPPPKESPGKRRSDKSREKKRKAEEEKERLLEMEKLGPPPAPVKLGVCLSCRHLSEEEKCVRLYEVHKRRDAKKFIGAAMTCVPPEDRLKPLPPAKSKDGRVKKKPKRIRYLNPEALGFEWIKPRPDTLARCGKDIARFVWKKGQVGQELVGGVRYAAMKPPTLEQLLSNHRLVTVRGVRRRDDIDRWNHGSMTGTGPRQPKGGTEGDGYGPYACHNGNTTDDIRALFRHAVDTDVLVEIGTTIIPTMKADIKEMTKENHTARMGRYGLTTFYCTNYISAIHPDYDVGRDDIKEQRPLKKCRGACYPCVQLEQTGTNKKHHEWDFLISDFGLAIETQSNTVWCFNGRHGHGSNMPGQSSYDAGAASLGKHPSARRVDGMRAEAIGRVRHGMKLRPRRV